VLSLAAARAVLDTLADGEILNQIERRGRRMLDGIVSLIDRHGVGDRVTVGGEPHRAVVGFPGPNALVDKSWVQQEQLQAGVLFNGSMFICARHTDEDVDRSLAAFDRAFEAMAAGKDLAGLLVGPPVQPVFRTP
jgi:glutamate-1-semialdehyde aminotransferase